MEKKLNKGIINLLPGPVEINPKVTKAFHKTPVSHRGDVFMADFKKLKSKLCQFVNAKHVEICTGSGTLGNEMIAAQLSQLEGKGLVLVNGEFGERLLSHAERIGLNHEAVIFPWGTPYSFDEIKRKIGENAPISSPRCSPQHKARQAKTKEQAKPDHRVAQSRAVASLQQRPHLRFGHGCGIPTRFG